MRRILLASTAPAFALSGAPALAQQQGGQHGGQQGGDQTLAQEQAAQQGAPLFVSPADVRQIQQALNNAGF